MSLSDKPIVVPADLSSGPVPRELVKGVVWDEHAESRFLGYVPDFMGTKLNMSLEGAIREAKWAVEAWLYRQMWFREIKAAVECERPAEKQRLVKDWIARYGRQKAQEFADAVLNKKRVEVVLKWGEA